MLQKKTANRITFAGVLAVLLCLTMPESTVSCYSQQEEGKIRFEISFPASVRSEPVTGRVFLIRTDDQDREPRLQVSRRGAPFFGVDVEDLLPGEAAVIDGSTLGSPVESLNDFSTGYYYIQALLNV